MNFYSEPEIEVQFPAGRVDRTTHPSPKTGLTGILLKLIDSQQVSCPRSGRGALRADHLPACYIYIYLCVIQPIEE